MDRQEFLEIRHYLSKTQSQMARLLGASLKTVQSYEQGVRHIPPHIERQILFLKAMHDSPRKKPVACWDVLSCPAETREKCPAWEFRMGNFCWFLNGTICHGESQKSWKKKMELCRKCKVFQSATLT